MRTNAMTKCAVGAMLFGGTLGVSTAHAGITWLGSSGLSGPGESFTYASASIYESWQEVTGAASLLESSFTSSGRTISFSAATASGFSMSLTGAGGSGWGGTAYRWFIVAEGSTVDIALSVNSIINSSLPYVTSGFQLQKWVNGNATEIAGGMASSSGPVSWSGTLTAGLYNVALDGYTDQSYSGTYASFSVVPAPGAAALVGMAGLVGGRRRRA